VEEASALEVVNTADKSEGGEATVQAESPFVTTEGEEVLSTPQDAVASTVEAETAVPVTGDKEALAVDEITPNVEHIETAVIPHAVADEDPIPPVEEEFDVPPAVVQAPVLSAVADEPIPPRQEDIPSVEQIHQEAAAFSAPGVEEQASSPIVEAGSQAHFGVADSEGTEHKEEGEQAAQEPMSYNKLGQAGTPKAADLATEGTVRVGESDPVLPPGLYPTVAQAESHSEALSASEAVPSVSVTTNVQRYVYSNNCT
jgi:hypothetical protein